MTSLNGLQPARAGQVAREPMQEPVGAARAQEMYPAWKAIFENARPSHSGPACSRPEQQWFVPERSGARAENFVFDPSQPANGRSAEAGNDILTAPARTQRAAEREGSAGAQSTGDRRASTAVPQVADVEPAAMPLPVASADVSEATADVAVRVHYLRPVSGQSAGELRSEVVNVILEGAQVSIVVRDTVLTEAEALRTAFETARELTGRSASLQRLTLNGRVLYEQASQAGVAPSADVLFAC